VPKVWLKRGVLWLGLLLCLYAIWHLRALAVDAIERVGAMTWAFVGILLVAGWLFAVIAWRRFLWAYTEDDPGWFMAMRQVGLLLVGKYVPGGVVGFLARMYDEPGVPRLRLFWAGLAEQAVAMAMSVALGGVLYLTASRRNMGWMCLIVLLPMLGFAGMWLLHRLATRLPRVRKYVAASELPDGWRLLSAIAAQLVQLLAWAALVAILARELFGLDLHAALGVAGAFWWGVALGMLAVFVPGGIGVREAALVGLASIWLDTAQAILLSALLRLLSTILDAGAGGMAAVLGQRYRLGGRMR
jgi:hypothetical protein